MSMSDMELDDHFDRVSANICGITGARVPRPGQIEAVRCLMYDQGDTVLVAATGYGKSAVLYAFSALTDKITIQIVPLTKLGENQRDEISSNIPNSKPVWVDGDTHLRNPNTWQEVQARQYSYVLLSPEQALNPKFKAILRGPGFHDKIGLFAIDELHCVGEWRDFWLDYTYLHTLRPLLPRCIPWFGCTATLDKDNQEFILKHAGFDIQLLKIIRTSVDRPEISIVVQPLLRGSVKDHRRIQFVLDGATPETVRQIPKTIIYLDSKPQLISARYTLMRYLRRKCGFGKALARKAIRRYDADVRQTDKDIIFKDSASTETDCRVIVATVSLGMGMDIPDVKRVIQFGLPPSPSLADIWQRFSRAMRKKQGQGIAYLFAPYWVFDHLGSVEDQPKKPRQRKTKRQQQGQHQHAPATGSRLRQMTLAGRDDDEIGSQASDASNVSQASQASQASRFSGLPIVNTDLTLNDPTLSSHNLFDFNKRVKWNKSEVNQLDKLDPVFKGFLNASCFRKYVLEYLQQEPDSPDLEHKLPVLPVNCCNACNHSLGRVPALAPREDRQQKPSTGTLAGVALEHLLVWCKTQAQELVPERRRRFNIIAEMFMDAALQYQMARLFSHGRGKPVVPFSDVKGLVEKVNDLKDWRHFDDKAADLVSFCVDAVDQIHEDWAAGKEKKAQDKEARRVSIGAPAALSGRKRPTDDDTVAGPSKR